MESYDGVYVTSPGRPGFPASVHPWSQADEKKYLDCFLKEINEKLVAGLDPEPNLSRSSKRPALYPAIQSGSVENIVFVGGSNAQNLSYAASNLGVNAYKIARGGWKISKENIEKLIPDLKELMSGLPTGTPIVLFCLDNSCFLAASEEGGMVPISKCVEGDDGYHVNGALVVAPDRALQFAVDQLCRIIRELGDYPIFIISPVTRYVSMPCCDAPEHVTNARDPDFLGTLISDLTKLKHSLRKRLSPAVVLDGIELICGSGCGRDRVEQTLMSGWASDPVHPNAHIYAKMALNIMEKVAPNPSKPGQPDGQQKRKRSESESVAGSGSASGSGNRGGGQQGHQSGPRGRGGRGGHGGSARGGRVQDAYSTQVRTHFLDNYSGRGHGPYTGPAAGGRQAGGHRGGGYPDYFRGQARGRRWSRW
jgi:hypothetical protein